MFSCTSSTYSRPSKMLLLCPVHHIHSFPRKAEPKHKLHVLWLRAQAGRLYFVYCSTAYTAKVCILRWFSPHILTQALTHSSKFRHSSWLIQHTVPPNTAEIIVFPLLKRRVPILSYDHSVSSGICCSSITLLPCSAPTPGDSSLVT